MKVHSAIRLFLALLVLLALAACASKQEADSGPDDMEKWRRMAEQSMGHSPSPRGDLGEADLEKHTVDKAQVISARNKAKDRALPSFKVSLRMHDADLIAILQALSRASGQSIVVSPNVQGTVNINIVDMPWDQVFKGVLRSNQLSYTWEGNIIRVMTVQDMEQDLQMEILRKKRQVERLALERTEPMSTAVVKIKYSEADDLKQSLDKFLSKGLDKDTIGNIEVDQHSNALIIQAIPRDLKKLVKLVSRLDAPRKQIRLKAYIVETTRDTARALGVQWGGAYSGRVRSGNNLWLVPGGTEGTAGGDPLAGGYTPFLNKENSGVAGQGYGINFLPNSDIYPSNGNGMALGMMFGKVGGNILEAQLHALETDNKLNIISSPSITTMDNQMAYTESGERVPYQSSSANEGTTVKFEDVVLRLEMTPHIIDESQIKLKLLVRKDEVGAKTVGDNPRITKKTTETTLIARDGETVVISGLNKEKTLNDDQGVPKLKDSSLFGWAFGTESKQSVMDEFLIFITPDILAEWKKGEQQKTLDEIEAELEELSKEAAGETDEPEES